MPNKEHFHHASIIWNYLKLDHSLQQSDLILVLGNPDTRTAEYASGLFLNGLASWIMFSGNEGSLTKGKWDRPEAHVFKEIAVRMGVPDEKILLEDKATNTGENVIFSYQVLKDLGLLQSITRIILVQMPFMERRTYATFQKQWPEGMSRLSRVVISSPDIEMSSYPNDDVGDMDHIIEMMIGCLERIKNYPKLGFQVEQDIPEEVWNVGKQLMLSGLYVNK